MEIYSLINYILAPFIISLTLLGSTFGLVVFTRPNLRKIGPINIYRFLFGIEYLNLLILLAYLNNFAINIISLSSTTCQLLSVIVLVYPQIPPMLHVYISIERYVSIAYPSKRLFLRKNNNQLIYFVGLIVYVTVKVQNTAFYILTRQII